jgi:choline dehydrogenase-like flavoprotein
VAPQSGWSGFVKDHYDYIIVGAGSSGCALANRLSADPAQSVLLVESGPSDKNPFIKMPFGIGITLRGGSKFIWEYSALTGGNRAPEHWFKGRTIGGSSSVNGMVYVRGAPLDYDGWEAMGCKGWGWDQIGRKFVELEDHDQGPAKWRGTGGPLRVSTFPSGDGICEAVIDAGVQMGVPRVADINDVDAVRDGGIGYQTTTTWKGKRWSSADAFLKPIRKRKNLEIVTETNALKVLFEGKRAVAVTLRDKAGTRDVRAKREIILSGGGIQTPKLLQLSGIGPAELLQTHGIPVIVDAPDVGRNLREHRYVQVNYKVRGGSLNPELSGWRIFRSLFLYFFKSKGPMTHAAHEVGAIFKSNPDLNHADVALGLRCLTASVSPEGKIGLDPFPGINILAYFTRPESQGELHIQSADPDAAPYINANHFSADVDRERAVAVFKWLRELCKQPALANWVIEETLPGPKIATDDDILTNLVTIGGCNFHISGTARMGVDDRAVLDPRLRVRGVEGLRVADTSIMPTLVSGNTNAPAMVIGLRAADFILEDQAQHA